MTFLRLPVWGVVAALALAGCRDSAPEIHRFGGLTMGSTYEVKFIGDVAPAKVRATVEELLAAFDLAFSKWRDDSEISRLNAAPAAAPFAVSERFASVLQLALDVAGRTEGAFDPTIGPLLAVYRAAKAAGDGHLDHAALAAAREQVGFSRVSLRDGAVHRDGDGVEVDLDGIVAGACIDAIAARLDGLGVPAFYLEVTGEVFCRGEKAPGVPWLIGVVDPRGSAVGSQMPIRALPLRDRALCTSGDYRNAIVVDGERMHHVFDPRTGRNAEHRVVSVSVLSDQAAVADALGTAFLVAGCEETRRMLAACRDFGEIGVLLLVEEGERERRLSQVAIGWPEAQ